MAIAGGGEALLVFATLGPNENGEVSPEPIPLRIVYRNEKHFSLPKSRRKDDITDTGWLPPCRHIKAIPFRDVWLIGKKELRWLWSMGKSKANTHQQKALLSNGSKAFGLRRISIMGS